MKTNFKLNLQLGEKNYAFILNNVSEIPHIAQNFCQKQKLNEQCVEYIIESFNQQIKDLNQLSFEQETIQNQSLSVQETYEQWQQIIKQKNLDKSIDDRKFNNSTFNKEKSSSKMQRSLSQTNQKSQSNTCVNTQTTQSFYEQLHNQSILKRTKQILYEKLKHEKLLKDCTFSPKISKSSSLIAQKKDKKYKDVSIVDKLYLKSKENEQKKDEICKDKFNQIHPFQPNNYRKISKKSLQEQQEFAQKQQQKHFSQQLLREQKKMQQQQSYSFHPQIHKDEYYRRAVEKEKIQILKFKEKQCKLDPKIIKIIKKWFNLMDSDQDGWISPDNIDLSRLPDLYIIQDILYEIDERNMNVNFEFFQNLLVRKPNILENILKINK